MSNPLHHHNDGLKKRCDCSRRKWAKCPHPWHFNFAHEGQHYRFSLHAAAGKPSSYVMPKAEAEALRDLYRSQIRDGTFNAKTQPNFVNPGAKLTVGDVFDRYLEDHVRKPSRKPSGRRTLEYRIKAARAIQLTVSGGRRVPFEQLPFDEVKQHHIEELEKEWQARPSSARGEHKGRVGANRALSVLRAFFKWAIRKGYRDDSPFMRHGVVVIGPDSKAESARVRRLMPGEEERLLAKAGARTYHLIVVALDTGCRFGELRSLQWSQVQWEQNSIVLPGAKTKTNSARAIPMTTRVKAVLDMRKLDPTGEELPATAYVFGNAVGERVSVGTLTKGWNKARRRANILDLHFHDLRREFGSRALEAGVPLHVVSRLLGHSNIATTSRYLSCTVTHEHDAIRKLEAHLERLAQPKPKPQAGESSEAVIPESRASQEDTIGPPQGSRPS